MNHRVLIAGMFMLILTVPAAVSMEASEVDVPAEVPEEIAGEGGGKDAPASRCDITLTCVNVNVILEGKGCRWTWQGKRCFIVDSATASAYGPYGGKLSMSTYTGMAKSCTFGVLNRCDVSDSRTREGTPGFCVTDRTYGSATYLLGTARVSASTVYLTECEG